MLVRAGGPRSKPFSTERKQVNPHWKGEGSRRKIRQSTTRTTARALAQARFAFSIQPAKSNASFRSAKRTERFDARHNAGGAVGCIALFVIQQLFMAEQSGSQNTAQRGCE
jgi:hypothetical protein